MKLAINVGIGFLIYWVLRFMGVPLEAFLVLGIVLAIGWPIGWFVGTLIGDETDVDTVRFKAIGWANLIAWLFPIAGIAVAKLSETLGKESINSRFFYEGMAHVGYGLVLINISLFAYLSHTGQIDSDFPVILSEHDHSDHNHDAHAPDFAAYEPEAEQSKGGARTFARCPYAAAEKWTAEEIEVHCNREPSEQEMREFELEMARANSSAH